MKASELIAMGVDVHAQDEECDLVVRDLDVLLSSQGTDDSDRVEMLRGVIRTLRDVADSAMHIHDGAPDVSEVTIARVRRFSAHMSAALKEIS